MKDLHLPFYATNRLKAELVEQYLIPAIDWLADTHDKTSSTVLPAKLGNLWETAYVILCLLRSKDIMEASLGFKGEYVKRMSDSARFLLDRVREDRDTANWDGGLYDTAIVIRALMEFIRTYPDDSNVSRASVVIDKGLVWLFKEVQEWGSERYSLGLADLSQTLRAVLLWEEFRQEKDINNFLEEKRFVKLPQRVADFIVDHIIKDLLLDNNNLSVSNEVSGSGAYVAFGHSIEARKKQETGFQTDIWNTSEVVLGLTSYYSKYKGDVDIIVNINDVLQKGIRQLETEHYDGKWGLPDATSLALMAYLRGCDTITDIEPEPHIVLKTVRWLCDAKQRFSDGSILHSTNHTVFFCLAIIDVCNRWLTTDSLKDISVIDIYDYVLWQMPTRTTVERAKRLETQARLEEERRSKSELEKRLAETNQRLRRWQVVTFTIFWILVGVFISIVFGFVQILRAKITEVSIPTFNVVSWEVLLTFLSIWSSLGFLVARRLIATGESGYKTYK